MKQFMVIATENGVLRQVCEPGLHGGNVVAIFRRRSEAEYVRAEMLARPGVTDAHVVTLEV